MPEVLEWLSRLEVWRRILGDIPLREGGLLDQPVDFMNDLAVADVARRSYRQAQSAAAASTVAEPPDDGPSPVTIDLMKKFNLV